MEPEEVRTCLTRSEKPFWEKVIPRGVPDVMIRLIIKGFPGMD
jgi:hypothetical protein